MPKDENKKAKGITLLSCSETSLFWNASKTESKGDGWDDYFFYESNNPIPLSQI